MKDKIKQRFKKIVPYILIAVLSSTAVLFSYDKGNEVYAMVGVDDVALAGLVTAILMSYGYVTLDYYNNTDGSSALANDWEEAYEQAPLFPQYVIRDIIVIPAIIIVTKHILIFTIVRCLVSLSSLAR